MANQTCNPSIITQALGITATGPRTVIVPADPIIWSAETSYEYLTLVASTDFGQGYISKKDVPSGTPLTDTDYWIPVASYNAQLAQIQQQIDQIDTELGGKAPTDHASDQTTYGVGSSTEYGHVKLSDEAGASDATSGTAATPKAVNDVDTFAHAQRIMIAIGDSFGVDSVTSPNFWHTFVAQGLGLRGVNYCEGSTGFATRNPSSQRNFTDNIQRAYDDDSFDNALVDYIVCFGGLNDRIQTSAAAISTALDTFMKKCHTLYPNAKLVVAGCNSWYTASPVPSYDNGFGSFNVYMTSMMRSACHRNGASFIPMLFATIGDSSCYAGTSDGNHYTLEGSRTAGGCILAGIHGNTWYKKFVQFNNCPVLDADGTQVGTASVNMRPYSFSARFNVSITLTSQLSNDTLFITTPMNMYMNIQQTGDVIYQSEKVSCSDGFVPRIAGAAPSKAKHNALFVMPSVVTTSASATIIANVDALVW